MTPLLRKIEEAVCGSNGGRAPRMAQYYGHCERAVFHALNALLLSSVRALAALLAPSGNGEPGAAAAQQQAAPAFMVHAASTGCKPGTVHHVSIAWSAWTNCKWQLQLLHATEAMQLCCACAQVSLHLSHPDVVVQPNVAEIKKAISRLALAVAESAKQFVRWMEGTCLEAAAIPGGALHACLSVAICCISAPGMLTGVFYNIVTESTGPMASDFGL